MIQIITDTSALYTPDQAKAAGFEAVPLGVAIGDLHGRDLCIDMEDFYGRIARGEMPQSSQPPIGDVLEVFEKYPDCQIINISMADGLSGTYQTACSAKEMVEHRDNITVINTKTLCGPHRYMVEKAQKMKEAGKTAKEIIAWLEYAAEHHESFLIPQDFGFLRRGGRLTPAAATLGSILKLKPIMTQTPDGKQLEKVGIKRTMKAALTDVVERLKKRGVDARHMIYVSHADALPDAKFAVSMLKEAFHDVEVQILELSPAFVTQGGPKCVAIQYIEK